MDVCCNITNIYVFNRFESFVLLPGEKKVEIEPDTRKFRSALGAS